MLSIVHSKRLLKAPPIFVAFYRKSTNDLESEARSYLAELDQLSSQKCYESSVAEWAYATDINDENEKVKLELSLDSAKFSKEISQNVTATFPLWREFKDPDLVRKLKKITILGAARLPDDQFKKVNKKTKQLTGIRINLQHFNQFSSTRNWKLI